MTISSTVDEIVMVGTEEGLLAARPALFRVFQRCLEVSRAESSVASSRSRLVEGPQLFDEPYEGGGFALRHHRNQPRDAGFGHFFFRPKLGKLGHGGIVLLAGPGWIRHIQEPGREMDPGLQLWRQGPDLLMTVPAPLRWGDAY